MARTFPVVTVSGILESGKTKFITDSLVNGDFGDLGRVLILACEEGTEEYNPAVLSKYSTCVYTFSCQDEFTVEKINELVKANRPQTIFVEMNAMWDAEKLKFPPYFLVEQAFTIIDATTFQVYFNNMRQKFSDMITASDLVIMNRCKPTAETAGYKRSLKIMNSRAQYILLDEKGQTLHLQSELPYIITDEMTIEDIDFGIWYIDTFDSPKRYDGKIVEFNCMTVLSKKLPPETFVAGRLAMTCCANDIQLIGHLCSYKNNTFIIKNKGWIRLRAKIHYVDQKGSDPQVILEMISMKEIPEITEPVVSLR